jgi:H+/Cl- antiporter ClcA
VTGNLWVLLWPGAPTSGFALIGAASVLATTQRAPLCAIVLIMEFTHTGLHAGRLPAFCAAIGSYTTMDRLEDPGYDQNLVRQFQANATGARTDAGGRV